MFPTTIDIFSTMLIFFFNSAPVFRLLCLCLYFTKECFCKFVSCCTVTSNALFPSALSQVMVAVFYVCIWLLLFYIWCYELHRKKWYRNCVLLERLCGNQINSEAMFFYIHYVLTPCLIFWPVPWICEVSFRLRYVSFSFCHSFFYNTLSLSAYICNNKLIFLSISSGCKGLSIRKRGTTVIKLLLLRSRCICRLLSCFL